MHDRLEEYIDSNGGLTYQWWVEAVRPVQVEESLWDDVDCGSSSFQGWGNLPDLQGLGMPQGIPCTGYLWNLEEPSLGTIGSALTGRFETACQRCEASQVLQLGTPNQLFGWPSWTGGKSVALGLPTLMLCPPNLTGFTKQCERSRWASRELRNREKSKTEISCPNLEEKVPAESHRSMSQNWGIYILWVTRKIPVFFSGENAGCQGFWCPCFGQTHLGGYSWIVAILGFMQATSVTAKIEDNLQFTHHLTATWSMDSGPAGGFGLGRWCCCGHCSARRNWPGGHPRPAGIPKHGWFYWGRTMKYQVLGSINWMHLWWGRIFWQLWVHVGLPSGYGPIHIILLGMPGGSGWCGVAWWQLRWLSTLGEHRSGPSRKGALTIQNQARGM